MKYRIMTNGHQLYKIQVKEWWSGWMNLTKIYRTASHAFNDVKKLKEQNKGKFNKVIWHD